MVIALIGHLSKIEQNITLSKLKRKLVSTALITTRSSEDGPSILIASTGLREMLTFLKVVTDLRVLLKPSLVTIQLN